MFSLTDQPLETHDQRVLGVVYLDGYEAAPVLLKKGVSPYSNNFTGELVGIQISLEFLADVSEVENRNIHIFTD